MSELKWLFLDLNSYFASVEQQVNPALRGRPVGVIPADTDYTCLIAASKEAKFYGLKTGTPVKEAKEKCPQIILKLGNHRQYIAYHERILQEIERHLPIDKVHSIDEVSCRLIGGQQEEMAARRLAYEIKCGIEGGVGKYLTCSIGIAPTRMLAKIATDMQKPDGLVVLHQEELLEKLQVLKLQDLPGIGPNMAARLWQAGVRDVRALWNLQPKHARAIWGSVAGERFWYELRGTEIPDLPSKPSVVGHSQVLPPVLREPEQARRVARKLLAKAAVRLREMNYYARVLQLRVRTSAGRYWAQECRGFQANDNITLLQALDALWQEMIRQQGVQPLKKVSVQLFRLTPCVVVQPDLFSTIGGQSVEERRQREELTAAMDKINKRFGRDKVTLGVKPLATRNMSSHQEGGTIAFGSVLAL